MYLEYYLMGIILLPAILLAIYAQSKVNSTYSKFSKVVSRSGITAGALVRRLLDTSNLGYIKIKIINGRLTDNYNPVLEEISLSKEVYSSPSISALGVACHEFGHALQKKEGYLPYKFRKVLIPVSRFASSLLWPLVLIGLILNIGAGGSTLMGDIFLWAGIGFFGLMMLLTLVTLPVEYNASNRALTILRSMYIMDDEELSKTKQVLRAAGLTYVASFLVAVLNLVRFLLIAGRIRRRN